MKKRMSEDKLEMDCYCRNKTTTRIDIYHMWIVKLGFMNEDNTEYYCSPACVCKKIEQLKSSVVYWKKAFKDLLDNC